MSNLIAMSFALIHLVKTITITRKGPVSLVKILDRITLDPFVNENMKRVRTVCARL